MSRTLEHRFVDFLKGLPDSEWLDSPAFCFPSGVRKADFLLDRRGLIAEIKTVTSDPQRKIADRIEKRLQETGGVIFGTVSSTQLFESAEESDQFHRRLVQNMTRSTEEMCRSANDQISQTSHHLSIQATGLLVILNEEVEVLDPGVIAYRVSEYLNARQRTFQYCLVVSEAHGVMLNGVPQYQILLVSAAPLSSGPARTYVAQLMRKWAAHNGRPYYEADITDPDQVAFIPRSRISTA